MPQSPLTCLLTVASTTVRGATLRVSCDTRRTATGNRPETVALEGRRDQRRMERDESERVGVGMDRRPRRLHPNQPGGRDKMCNVCFTA